MNNTPNKLRFSLLTLMVVTLCVGVVATFIAQNRRIQDLERRVEVLSDPTMWQRYAELKQQLGRLETVYLSHHPEMIEIRRQLAELENYVE